MKSITKKLLLQFVLGAALAAPAVNAFAQDKKTSGNPVVEGWYADPEAKIFKSNIGYTQHTLPNIMSRYLWMPFHRPIWCIGPNTATLLIPAA